MYICYIIADANFPRHPESVIVTSTTPTGVTIQWMLTEPFNATPTRDLCSVVWYKAR